MDVSPFEQLGTGEAEPIERVALERDCSPLSIGDKVCLVVAVTFNGESKVDMDVLVAVWSIDVDQCSLPIHAIRKEIGDRCGQVDIIARFILILVGW